MGNFYTNYTLRGPTQQSVATILAGRSAIVTPAKDGCVVVYDEESDDQNTEIIAELAAKLSSKSNCPLLAVFNHDDDIFWYQLYLNGELMDEYNSSPNYFNPSEVTEDEYAPAGGDAEKICKAFEVKTSVRVKQILNDANGYTFAFERHADLAEALSIPSFVVGGFSQISEGELPNELSENDLIRTKDLVADLEASSGIAQIAIPSYYKISFRAHPKLTKSIPTSWMPNLWADLECAEQNLSDKFHRATATYRDRFKKLGFIEQGFKKNNRILNPLSLESGGINYLDYDHRYFGQILYSRSCTPPTNEEKERVVIAFTAVFQNETFSCTNHHDFLNPIPNHNVIRLQSNDADFIYKKFIEHLKQRVDSPRRFEDLLSLKKWFDVNAQEIFEYRVHSGAFVRMSDFEVEAARCKL